MSATTKVLMTVEVVTDHDCGNYQIGDVDFSINCELVESFLKEYGRKGFEDLILKLNYLSYWARKEFENLSEKAEQMSTSETKGI